MDALEVKIDERWWRVARVSDVPQFKIERHTPGVGWDTLLEHARLTDDECLIHKNDLDEEVVECIEAAIGEFLHEFTAEKMYTPNGDKPPIVSDAD